MRIESTGIQLETIGALCRTTVVIAFVLGNLLECRLPSTLMVLSHWSLLDDQSNGNGLDARTMIETSMVFIILVFSPD